MRVVVQKLDHHSQKWLKMRVVVQGLDHYSRFVINTGTPGVDNYSLGRSSLPKSTVMSPLLLEPNS